MPHGPSGPYTLSQLYHVEDEGLLARTRPDWEPDDTKATLLVKEYFYSGNVTGDTLTGELFCCCCTGFNSGQAECFDDHHEGCKVASDIYWCCRTWEEATLAASGAAGPDHEVCTRSSTEYLCPCWRVFCDPFRPVDEKWGYILCYGD